MSTPDGRIPSVGIGWLDPSDLDYDYSQIPDWGENSMEDRLHRTRLLPDGLRHAHCSPLFAMARIAGWTAHIKEQLAANSLIRPLSAGPDQQERPR